VFKGLNYPDNCSLIMTLNENR